MSVVQHFRAPAPVFALLIAACAAGARSPEHPDLKSLYQARRWIELREALHAWKGPALYRGAIAAVFNDDQQAERLLRSVIAAAPHSDDAYQAYEWLAHIYFRTGEYRQFITDMEARWTAFPGKAESKEERAAVAGFRGLPDQITGKPRSAKLAHDTGTIFIPIAVNRRPATYFFDTGAWVNCMSESEAKRLGLEIRESSGTLGTATSARTEFRTAVAPEILVGRTRFRNVSFAVFHDDQEPWSDLPAGRRGLVGIPVILGLRSLRWTQDGVVETGMDSKRGKPRTPNLFFDDDHLVVTAEVRGRSVLATLDTGAETTDLYQGFAQEFADLLNEAGRKDRTEVRGVGHAETFESITLPQLKINIGRLDAVLHPAHVLPGHKGATCCVGNFGLDLLKQGSAFRIDFSAMTLDIEPQ